MRINRLSIVGFVIVMIGFQSCGQKKQSTPADSKSDRYNTFQTSEYSIKYPVTWDFNNSGQMGMAIQIFSAQTSPADNFRENVNLIIQDLTGQKVKTLEQFTQLSESQIKTMMTDGQILSSDKLSRDGQDYQKVISTAVQGQYNLKFEQYYLIKGHLAYVLTLTCLADKFDEYREVGEKILDSFTTKK